MKAAIVLLILLSLGLGAALFYRHTMAVQAENERLKQISQLSNHLAQVRQQLDEQQTVNQRLTQELAQTKQKLDQTQETLAQVNNDLAKTRKQAQADIDAAKLEIANRDKRIQQLEAQRTDLSNKMNGLMGQIEKLTQQIEETQRKLDASEGDRQFLLAELKRLQAEKADLERQFNDLRFLRTQVAKLKEQLTIARRLEWIRSGLYGSMEKKGAEILLSAEKQAGPASYDLNVELKQEGGARVVTNKTSGAKAPK